MKLIEKIENAATKGAMQLARKTVASMLPPARGEMPPNQLKAYPGWRWRIDEGGVMYHEKIPNPILRFCDWAWSTLTCR